MTCNLCDQSCRDLTLHDNTFHMLLHKCQWDSLSWDNVRERNTSSQSQKAGIGASTLRQVLQNISI